MATKRRKNNNITTDLLEEVIGYYESCDDTDGSNALRYLALEIDAPIDNENIKRIKSQFMKQAEKWEKEAEAVKPPQSSAYVYMASVDLQYQESLVARLHYKEWIGDWSLNDPNDEGRASYMIITSDTILLESLLDSIPTVTYEEYTNGQT